MLPNQGCTLFKHGKHGQCLAPDALHDRHSHKIIFAAACYLLIHILQWEAPISFKKMTFNKCRQRLTLPHLQRPPEQ